MPYNCPYCSMKITGINAFINHKRKHMGGNKVTPIVDPLNSEISRFVAPKTNNVWRDSGVKI